MSKRWPSLFTTAMYPDAFNEKKKTARDFVT